MPANCYSSQALTSTTHPSLASEPTAKLHSLPQRLPLASYTPTSTCAPASWLPRPGPFSSTRLSLSSFLNLAFPSTTKSLSRRHECYRAASVGDRPSSLPKSNSIRDPLLVLPGTPSFPAGFPRPRLSPLRRAAHNSLDHSRDAARPTSLLPSHLTVFWDSGPLGAIATVAPEQPSSFLAPLRCGGWASQVRSSRCASQLSLSPDRGPATYVAVTPNVAAKLAVCEDGHFPDILL